MSAARISRLAPTFVACVLALSGAGPAAAQRAGIATGSRIRADVYTTEVSRVRRVHDQALTGEFAGMAGDTVLLAVRPGLAPIRLPESSIRELFVSRGRRGRLASAARNAWLPALIGGALGAATGTIRSDGDSPGRAAVRRAATAAAFAGATGAFFPKERWERLWRAEAPR